MLSVLQSTQTPFLYQSQLDHQFRYIPNGFFEFWLHSLQLCELRLAYDDMHNTTEKHFDAQRLGWPLKYRVLLKSATTAMYLAVTCMCVSVFVVCVNQLCGYDMFSYEYANVERSNRLGECFGTLVLRCVASGVAITSCFASELTNKYFFGTVIALFLSLCAEYFNNGPDEF